MGFVVITLPDITAAVSRELLGEGISDQHEWGIELRDKSTFIINEQILLTILHMNGIPRVAQGIASNCIHGFNRLRELLLRSQD